MTSTLLKKHFPVAADTLFYAQKYLATGNNIMLKTLSIRTGLLSLLAVMTLLLLIVSGIGIYALTQSSTSLQRINHLQGEQMVQLNSGYTLILRARNEAGQAVRMMEIGMLDDAAKSVKTINQEVAQAQKTLKGVMTAAWRINRGSSCWIRSQPALRRITSRGSTRC
jgi:phosphoglycerate-specific signal transduction histidine kinase